MKDQDTGPEEIGIKIISDNEPATTEDDDKKDPQDEMTW